jgi:hypothetical protein
MAHLRRKTSYGHEVGLSEKADPSSSKLPFRVLRYGPRFSPKPWAESLAQWSKEPAARMKAGGFQLTLR